MFFKWFMSLSNLMFTIIFTQATRTHTYIQVYVLAHTYTGVGKDGQVPPGGMLSAWRNCLVPHQGEL